MKKSIIFLFSIIIFSTCVESKQKIDGEDYRPFVTEQQAKKEIAEFSKEMAKKHQFNEKEIFNLLSDLEHRKDIIKRITKPAESMSWHRYRKIFIQPKRIQQGVEFWNKHEDLLLQAEKKFGIDPAIIVGIIGVETFYGKIQGHFPVIEALHTLGFYYPKRSKFFRSELAQYLILAREQNWNLNDIKGSYAGAMGMGQFISSSYRHYGIDFNNDGKVNLFDDTADMIGSVANYFYKHHWKKNGFVAQPIRLDKQQLSLIQKGLKLKYDISTLEKKDIDISNLKGRTKKAGIFAFENKNSKEYWLVGNNFYSITRYNHSELYALAAFQLSEAIREERNKQKN